MSPFIKKKKPGMELDEPDPLDMPPPKPPRAARTTIAVANEPVGGAPPYRPPKAAPMAEEAGGEDYGEDFGQKLADDIDGVSEAHGMDVNSGRQYAADLFAAVSDCLAKAAGGGGEEAAPETEETEEYT